MWPDVMEVKCLFDKHNDKVWMTMSPSHQIIQVALVFNMKMKDVVFNVKLDCEAISTNVFK